MIRKDGSHRNTETAIRDWCGENEVIIGYLLPAGLHYQRVLADSGLAFSQAFPEIIGTVLVHFVVALELDGAVVFTLVITVLDPLPLGHFKALGSFLVDLFTEGLVHIVKLLV